MFQRVTVQTEDFDVSQELNALRAQDLRVGAVCSFVGTVRDTQALTGVAADEVQAMALEQLRNGKHRADDTGEGPAGHGRTASITAATFPASSAAPISAVPPQRPPSRTPTRSRAAR